MIVVVSKYLIPKGYRGITLFPFIVVRNKLDASNNVVINHEKIHIQQQLELLILPFFIWYGVEFIWNYFRYHNWREAYLNISFEREAYAKEKDLNYLEKRPFWNFFIFL